MEKEKKQIIIVKGLVLNANNEILFVRRKREWHKEAHDKWEFPGGKIDFGETPEEAILREIKEESGYTATIITLLPKILSAQWEYETKQSQQILICYICKKYAGEPVLTDHGVSEIKWFTYEHAKTLDCLPGIQEFLEEYAKQKGIDSFQNLFE